MMRVVINEPVGLWQEALEHVVRHLGMDPICSSEQGSEQSNAPSAVPMKAVRRGHGLETGPTLDVIDVNDAPASGAIGWLQTRLREDAPVGAQPRGRWSRPTVVPKAPTPTELKIVRLIAGGLTSPQIAERLSVSASTVASHRRRLYRRWGVHSAHDAIRVAASIGLLVDSEGAGPSRDQATQP